jgi:hypothetical protein
MRRFVASLVLSLVAWSFVAPMALALTGNDAPACCRRNGKHHCQMAGMAAIAALSGDGIPSFSSHPSDCPYRSQKATPTGTAAPHTETVSAQKLPLTDFVFASDSGLRYSQSPTGISQRGPPAFSL